MKRKPLASASPVLRLPKLRLSRASSTTVAAPICAIALALLIGLYLFRLATLIPAGAGELHTIHSMVQASSLVDNPLLLPYKLVAFVLLQLPINDLLAVRLVAAAIALLTAWLFFMVAKRWYGLFNGSITTVLFVASGWLLHTGRYGAGYAMFAFVTLCILNLFVWLNHTDKSGRGIVAYALSAGLALCVPGGIWLMLVGSLICRKALGQHIKAAAKGSVAGSGLILVGVLAALGFALFRNPGLIYQWLAIPADFPPLSVLAEQTARGIAAIFAYGPFMPEIWLAHTPLLDAASSILLLTGIVFYAHHVHNIRTRLLAVCLAVGMLLVTLNGPVALGFLVPVIYLIVAGGLAYWLHQWRRVFPYNPIAKATAMVVLAVLVVGIVSFHSQRYFLAWRYSPDTVQAYMHGQTYASEKTQAGQRASNKDITGNKLDNVPYLIQ